MNRIDAFLELAVKQGGSDLHLVSGQTPRIRLHGDLEPVRFRELSVGDIQSLLEEFMTPGQKEALADFIIDNNRTKTETKKYVAKVWKEIVHGSTEVD